MVTKKAHLRALQASCDLRADLAARQQELMRLGGGLRGVLSRVVNFRELLPEGDPKGAERVEMLLDIERSAREALRLGSGLVVGQEGPGFSKPGDLAVTFPAESGREISLPGFRIEPRPEKSGEQLEVDPLEDEGGLEVDPGEEQKGGPHEPGQTPAGY